MKDKGVMSLKVRTGQWLLWWEGLETQIKIHGGVPRIPHQVSFFTLLTYSSWWAGKWAFCEIKSVLNWRQRKKKTMSPQEQHATLLILKMEEGAMSQGMQGTLL